jgi:hypothetical protein
VLSTKDAGNTWHVLNTGYKQNLYSVYFFDESTGYVVGDAGLILKTFDSRSTWQREYFPINSPFTKIYFVENSLLGIIFSGRTVLEKIIDKGKVWQPTTDLSIYHNPASDNISIDVSIDFSNEKSLTLYIYDSAGKLVVQKQINNLDKTITIKVKFTKGIYNVVLTNGDRTYKGNIVIE